LGLTQAQLAARLRVALPTLGAWESYSPPSGIRLEKLALFAERQGDYRSAEDFRIELALAEARVLPMFIPVYSEEEARYAFAVNLALREERFAELRPALQQMLTPALAACDHMMSELRKGLAAVKGLNPESTLAFDPLPPTWTGARASTRKSKEKKK
jgi:hypothetical protein